MAIDTRGLLAKLSDGTNLQATANTDPFVTTQVYETLKETRRLLNNVKIEEAMQFILCNGLWNSYGIYGSKKNQAAKPISSQSYKLGDVLSVQLGVSNIGHEESYLHNGIVIAD
jgi:hypothetical protein